MAMNTVRCPACSRSGRIRTDMLGKQLKCRSCGKSFLAEDQEGAAIPVSKEMQLLAEGGDQRITNDRPLPVPEDLQLFGEEAPSESPAVPVKESRATRQTLKPSKATPAEDVPNASEEEDEHAESDHHSARRMRRKMACIAGLFIITMLAMLGMFAIGVYHLAEKGTPAPMMAVAPTTAAPTMAATLPPIAPVVLAPDALFAQVSPAVVQILVYAANGNKLGQGSGFFLSSDGILATNYHVIEKAASAVVQLPDEKFAVVEGLLAHDRDADVALLKIRGTSFRWLELAGDLPPPVGTKVYAIGSPRGFQNTLSDGLVSGHRENNGRTVIQTTAAISPGSSGGPLLTANGKVIGITTAGFVSGAQNLNLAVPTATVKTVMSRMGPVQSLSSGSSESVAKSKPKDLIIGKWERPADEEKKLDTLVIDFRPDSSLTMKLGSVSVDGKYKFTDHSTIEVEFEVRGKKISNKMKVEFNKDELVTTDLDGRKDPVTKFKKAL